jgi:hypothetical protein
VEFKKVVNIHYLKTKYGLIAILSILFFYLGIIIFNFNEVPSLVTETFGPLWVLLTILLLAATISIFVNYDFNWMVISLPFLWILFQPFETSQDSGMLSVLYQFFFEVGKGNFILPLFLEVILLIFIIIYLTFVGRKNAKPATEIFYAVIILLLFVSRFL